MEAVLVAAIIATILVVFRKKQWVRKTIATIRHIALLFASFLQGAVMGFLLGFFVFRFAPAGRTWITRGCCGLYE